MHLFSRITILDPIMWPYPFQNQNPKNQKPKFQNQTWGLKWCSSQTSMLNGAFVLTDHHFRPNHVVISLPKSYAAKNSKLCKKGRGKNDWFQISKVHIVGPSKWRRPCPTKFANRHHIISLYNLKFKTPQCNFSIMW